MSMAIVIMHKLQQYQISKWEIAHYFKFLKSDNQIILLLSRLPDIVWTYFCSPDGDIDPTFQMFVSMFVARETIEIQSENFFKTPVEFKGEPSAMRF